MERQFKVYKIVCTNGRYYIGYTVQSLNERLRQHTTRALNGEARSHPFYQDIREYGADAFQIIKLAETADRHQAMFLEKTYISSEECPQLYNLSSGGLEDASCGGKIFWGRLNENPEERKEYIKKLSEVKKSRDWTDYDKLLQKSQEWRRANPKEAYKLSYRAIRIANRHRNVAPKEDERGKKDILMWKYKRSDMTRKNALRLWQNRTEEEKREIGNKISIAQKKRMKDIAVLPEFQQTQWPYAKATVLRKIRQGMGREEIIKDAINNVENRGSHWREVREKLNNMGVSV
jgi:predicted GIY-YIG superfamily endonuclease